jgi:hypothetical protein
VEYSAIKAKSSFLLDGVLLKSEIATGPSTADAGIQIPKEAVVPSAAALQPDHLSQANFRLSRRLPHIESDAMVDERSDHQSTQFPARLRVDI